MNNDTPYCTSCLRPCTLVLVDFGIGVFEYAGTVGFDLREGKASGCCEAPVTYEVPERENDDQPG